MVEIIKEILTNHNENLVSVIYDNELIYKINDKTIIIRKITDLGNNTYLYITIDNTNYVLYFRKAGILKCGEFITMNRIDEAIILDKIDKVIVDFREKQLNDLKIDLDIFDDECL